MTDSRERASFTDRIVRNREIVRLRDEEGLGWDAVAERTGVSVRTAERGYADHLLSAAPGSLAEIDVEAIALRVIESHLASMDRLEQLASGGNENAVLGACSGRARVGASLLAVLARVGLLPDSGDRWRTSLELHQIARELIEACRRHGVPSEVAEEVFGVATTAAERLNPPPWVNGTVEEVPA